MTSNSKLPIAWEELWTTLGHLGMDAGIAAHLMVADRYHLYGRDILPITYRTTVLGDPYAARAERMLLDHIWAPIRTIRRRIG